MSLFLKKIGNNKNALSSTLPTKKSFLRPHHLRHRRRLPAAPPPLRRGRPPPRSRRQANVKEGHLLLGVGVEPCGGHGRARGEEEEEQRGKQPQEGVRRLLHSGTGANDES